jgi:hypothetical protein
VHGFLESSTGAFSGQFGSGAEPGANTTSKDRSRKTILINGSRPIPRHRSWNEGLGRDEIVSRLGLTNELFTDWIAMAKPLFNDLEDDMQ